GGLPHRRVVHVQVVADGPDHHLTRVQADADLYLDPVPAADGRGGGGAGRHLPRVQADADLYLDPVPAADVHRVAADCLLHGQGRVTGPHGVILMGDRGAKQGHDAVAHDLVHGALVAVHGVHHALQDRVEELSGLLGVAVGQ